MNDTMTRYLTGIKEAEGGRALRAILLPIVDRMSTQPLNAAGLVISGAGATNPIIGPSPFYATVQGKLVTLAAAAALPAPTGLNIAIGRFGIACYFVDVANVVSVASGATGATLVTAGWPVFPANKALFGILVVTGGVVFNGGATALDAVTTIYLSPTGPFDPSVLV